MASAANRTPAGVYNDRVRDIFGMQSGAHSSTSGTAVLKKLVNTTEDTRIQSAANDNKMLREMQNQTSLLKKIQSGVGGGFGLTDFLMGSWLNRIMKFAVGGIVGGIGVAGKASGAALKVVGVAVKSAAVGAAALLKGSVLGVIRPFTAGIGKFFAPLAGITKSITALFKVPQITGVFSAVTKMVPNFVKTFGGLAGKLLWPITALMAAIDGIGGFMNAEELLGRDGVNIGDRILAGLSSAINGVLFGLPDWLSQKIGFNNLASMVDTGVQKFNEIIGKHITGFIGNVVSGVSNLFGSVGKWLKDGFFNMVGWVKDNIDFSPGKIGSSIGQAVSAAVVSFGSFIKDSVVNTFQTIQTWVGESFEALKREISNWMPWNWSETGPENQYMGNLRNQSMANRYGVFDPAGNKRDPIHDSAKQFFTPVRPQTSAESPPIGNLLLNSPSTLLRLNAVGAEANEFNDGGGLLLYSPSATQQVITQTVDQTATVVEDVFSEVTEHAQEEFTDLTDKVEKNFLQVAQEILGNLGDKAKPVFDAAAGAIADSFKLWGLTGQDQLTQMFGADAAETLMPGLTTTPGGGTTFTPTAPATSHESMPGAGGQAPIPTPANPTGSPGYVPGFVDPSTNPDVNPDVLKRYEGRRLPVSIRNNNMGAVSITGDIASSWAARQEGFVGVSQRPANEGGYYAKYATPEHGVAAASKLLERYGGEGVNTTDAIVRKWSADRGAWGTYSATLQKYLKAAGYNVSGSTQLDLSDPGVREAILRAKSAHESGAGVPVYNDRVFKDGVNYNLPKIGTPPPTPANQAKIPADPNFLPDSVLDMPVKVDTQTGKTSTLRDLGVQTYDDLRTKGGQAFQGGFNDPNTTWLTAQIAKNLGENFDRVTAQNDGYKGHAPGGHDSGTKTDFTVKGISERAAHERTSQYLKSLGLEEGKDYKIISRPHGNGPHLDFKLNPSGQRIVEGMRVNEAMTRTPAIPAPTMDGIGKGSNWGEFTKQFGQESGIGPLTPSGNGAPVPLPRNPLLDTGHMPSFRSMELFSGAAARRDAANTGLQFGMDLIRRPATGGAQNYEFMDAVYNPLIDAMQMTPYRRTAGPALYQNERGGIIGPHAIQPKDIGEFIAQGFMDEVVQQPKQQSFIPLEAPTGGIGPTAQTPAGSKVAENPTGTPSKAVQDMPDLGAMPSIDELSLLLINTDMMGA